jgi:AcrR family transcriptional regulator
MTLRKGVNRDSLLYPAAVALQAGAAAETPMPYRPTPQTEARKAGTRTRILDAALAELTEGTYASVGMQAIAARAGIATGGLYRYFPSKAELFAEVFRRGSERELRILDEAQRDDGRPAAERIGAGVEAFARRALAAPVRAHAIITERVDPALEDERVAFRTAYRERLREILEAGVHRGELRPHDSETIAAAVVGAVGEALAGPLSRHGGGDATVASLVDFCMRAIPREESRAGHAAHA